MTKRLICLACILVLCALSAGCQLRAKESPTKLTYKLPTKLTIDAGEALPGTNIVYQELSERGAHLLIDGQVAVKRKGDSFKWEGSPSDGVDVELDLRVAWYNDDQVHLVGMAKVVIDGVTPSPAKISTDSDIKYAGAVAYNLLHMINEFHLQGEDIKRSMEWLIRRIIKAASRIAYSGRRC